jgi:phospholipid/cholesterol/gamma-HCH transport system substrate-binding protein
MKENVVETILGAVVLLGAAFFLFFLSQSAGVGARTSSYEIDARFRSVEGIVLGSDVRMAGVKIGSVTDISLDSDLYLANTRLSVENGILVPDDSEAAVASEGLLGGAFIEIVPGASEFMLEGGDELVNTQSAVSLLNLLIRFASQSGSSDQ